MKASLSNGVITSADWPGARAPTGFNRGAAAWWRQLDTQPAHIPPDDVGAAVEVETPDVVRDAALRKALVGMVQEVLQDRDPPRGGVDLLAANPHPPRRRI